MRSPASGWRWPGSVAKRRKRKAPALRASGVEVSLMVFLTNYRQMNVLLGRTRVRATVERVEEV